MEHEKEHHHAEATKRVDERREERDRRNQATQQIEQVEDEIPHQKSRHQNRSDQCQQRRIFECHGRSMDAGSARRNSRLLADGHCSSRKRMLRYAVPLLNERCNGSVRHVCSIPISWNRTNVEAQAADAQHRPTDVRQRRHSTGNAPHR